MVQTESVAPLSLQLAPQRFLDATSPTGENVLNLLIYPGIISDLLFQLENTSNRSLRWRLELEGEFPSNWYNWTQEEDEKEIASRQKITKTIRFFIPEDFFENQFAVTDRQPQLKLNYEARILLYVEQNNRSQLVVYRLFSIFVRLPSTYINLLPPMYKEVDFLNRFLNIFEQTFDPAVQTLGVLWAYLDPLTAPESMLPFLASWVAWEIDDRLDIKRQRRLISNAVTLYRWHGTLFGLRFYLHLCTGLPLDEHLPEPEKHIGIEEVFNDGFILGETILGQDSIIGGGRPYHFFVYLRPEKSQQIEENLVREIIEREKPAFCTYELNIIYRD